MNNESIDYQELVGITMFYLGYEITRRAEGGEERGKYVASVGIHESGGYGEGQTQIEALKNAIADAKDRSAKGIH
jgi:hypothetical protein